MTGGAVLEARASQVMQRRRHRANGSVRRTSRPWQIGMALQTDELHLRTSEHPWIYRAVRLVAGTAPFQLDRRMLKDERSPQVAVALHAPRFIGIYKLQVALKVAPVWIVATHARHGAFRQAVPVRPLEAGPDINVALRAELIHSNDSFRY